MTERPEEGLAARMQPAEGAGQHGKGAVSQPANTGPKFPLKGIWILILWATEAIKEFLLGQ